jgi:hypothetical protein
MNSKTKYSLRIPSLSTEAEVPFTSPTDSPVPASPSELSGPLSNRTRFGTIRDNLRDGMSFLEEQERQLGFGSMLLDELRSLPNSEKPEIVLRKQLILQGLVDIAEAKFKKVLLFGNGAESPLKIHVIDHGERKAVELRRANLCQPAFQSILQSGASISDMRFAVKPSLAAAAIAEIINLRFANQRQRQRLQEELNLVERRLARTASSRRRLFAGSSPFASKAKHSKSTFRKLGAAIRSLCGELSVRFNALRAKDPVWEEMPASHSRTQI